MTEEERMLLNILVNEIVREPTIKTLNAVLLSFSPEDVFAYVQRFRPEAINPFLSLLRQKTGLLREDLKAKKKELTEAEQELLEIQEKIMHCVVETKPLDGSGVTVTSGHGWGKNQYVKRPGTLRGEPYTAVGSIPDPRPSDKRVGGGELVQLLDRIVPPQVMKRFYPRVYQNVGQYHSPRTMALFLSEAMIGASGIGIDKVPSGYKILLPALVGLEKHRVPTFFLAPDLLEAIKRTDFPEEIDWANMKLPFEEGCLVLPHGGLTHPAEGDVGFIFWSRVRPGEYESPYPGIPRMNLNNEAFSFVGLCPQAGTWYDSTVNTAKPRVKLRNLFYREKGQAFPSHEGVEERMLESPISEADAPFLEEIGVIVFGTLLAMDARPELLEVARLDKVVPAKGDKPRKEFWYPNMIGRRYRLKRQPLGGTHASPRLHWRRGFYRSQPYGLGRAQRRTIWIEPCLVSGRSASND